MQQSIRRAHVIVRGRIQGVGYRYAARSRATSLAVNGWIRNRPDGSVEAVFEGALEHVELLLRWCREGPSAAYVDEIEIEWKEPTGEQGFAIR